MAYGVKNLFDYRDARQPTIPNTVLNDPNNRSLRVITVGAGVAGILNAYNIQKHCSNVEHVVYDKNADIGGTWFENRYPGCACDVPSHAYAYHFAPNPDWPRFLSKREDIWAYLDRVCRVFDLRRFMEFQVQITKATWDDDAAQWRIKGRRTLQDGTVEDLEDQCDVFLYCTGILNNWRWPNIEGLQSFKGRIIHSASWPEDFDAEQWKGKRVAVIGSGASSLQIVPSMQPDVASLDIFVRTGVWFAALVEGFSEGHIYSEEDRAQFRKNPDKLVDHVKYLDGQLNAGWPAFIKDSEAQTLARMGIQHEMAKLIKDKRLLQGFTPAFAVGCRRITPGAPYLKAIQEDNVSVRFTSVDKIAPEGPIGGDGVKIEADVIICATGFDVSFAPRFPIIGRSGVSLTEQWRENPVAYLGLSVPDMPNMVIQGGPPSPVQNGTPFGTFHAQGQYSINVIQKLQRDNIRSLEPKRDIAEAFVRHTDDYHKNTVFSDTCRSWYKNNETGRTTAVWPGSALHFREIVGNPRWEHYNIDYRDAKNIFAFMGVGLVKELLTPGMDTTSYLNTSNIDPLWLKEMQDHRLPEGTKINGNEIEEIEVNGAESIVPMF